MVKVEVVEGTHPDGDTVSMSATFDWSWAELAGVVSPWLLCWRSPGDEGLACEASYLVQNIFTHGLFHLHPEVTASDCCNASWWGSGAYTRGPWYFGLDATYLREVCVHSAGDADGADDPGVPFKDDLQESEGGRLPDGSPVERM